MKNKMSDYTNDQIYEILKISKSFAEVIRSFGYKSITTGNYKHVKGILKNRNIEIPVYNYFKEHNNFNRKRRNVDELFINETNVSRAYLKRRIIKDDLIKYECEKCGNVGEWEGQKLVLQLEHKNGNTYDNRLENLCFLCPNCHSQTNTFSGKNSKRIRKNKNEIKKRCNCGKEISYDAHMCVDCYSKTNRIIKRPTYEELIREIKETSQNKVAKKYEVSWRTIQKWIKYYEKSVGLDLNQRLQI